MKKTTINQNKLKYQDIKKIFKSLNLKTHKTISPQNWAEITQLLIDHEMKPGGPYYDQNKKLDISLNIHIAAFLKKQGIILPSLIDFIKNNKNKLNSREKKLKKIILNSTPKENQSKTKKINTPKNQEKIKKQILQQINKEIDTWPKNIVQTAQQELKNLSAGNKNTDIPLLTLFFANSLSTEDRKNNKHLIIPLGKANLYLWLAYKIYDDILDNEGKPELLPIANLCLLNFSQTFNNLKLDKQWKYFFHKTIAEMESCNYQEAIDNKKYCQNNKIIKPNKYSTNNFRLLYKKSLPHAFGPLAIYWQCSKNIRNHNVKTLINFFCLYLSARQLSDDLHDWLDDLKNKQINSVTRLVLSQAKQKEFTAPKDIEKLKQIFLNQSLPVINQEMTKLLQQASDSLNKCQLIKNSEPLLNLLSPLTTQLKKSKRNQKNLLIFKEQYLKNKS